MRKKTLKRIFAIRRCIVVGERVKGDGVDEALHVHLLLFLRVCVFDIRVENTHTNVEKKKERSKDENTNKK